MSVERVFRPLWIASFGVTLCSVVARPALAAPPSEPAKTEAEADATKAPPLPPLPPDERVGHLQLSVGAGVELPFGTIGGTIDVGDVIDAGFAAQLAVALGITRYSSIDVRGAFTTFLPGGGCASCEGRALGASLGLTYHAAQGIAFDPWVRFGAGYRNWTLKGDVLSGEANAPLGGTYHAIDVAQIALGGDFLPLRHLGFGLYAEGDVGVFAGVPSALALRNVYGSIQIGFRVSIEPQGRGQDKAPSQTGLRRPYNPAAQ